MNWLTTLLIATLLIGCATPVSPPATTPAWTLVGEVDYESQHPGLGKSLRYQSAQGWIDMYSYNAGRADWRDGVSDPLFIAVFDGAVKEIVTVGQKGIYRSVRLGKVDELVIDGQTYRHCPTTLIAGGRRLDSHLYLTAKGGRLLKYRMSFFEPTPANLPEIMQSFIRDSARRIGESI